MVEDADPTGVFVELRPTLFGIAYRMLGSASDAEDVVQDAWLRWQAVDAATVDSPVAFLTTVVTRLSLDLLGSARVRRERYVGPWLPEPVATPESDPAVAAELADSLSLAFLVLLEELTPPQRAAFLLHDVFGHGYDAIATALGRSEPAARQLVSRARAHVAQRRQRFDADRRRGEQLTAGFLEACLTGDLDAMLELLAEDAVVWADGGGKAKAPPRPITGARKSARFLLAIAATVSPDTTVDTAELNGQPGILLRSGGSVVTAIVLDVLAGRIVGVRVVANPDKLVAVNSAARG